MTIDRNSYIGSINGTKCTTKDDALLEIGKAFDFPEHYGKNLDALYDCLTDLSWLHYNKVYLIINNQEEFLKNESSEVKKDFLDLIDEVSEEWKNNEEDNKQFNLLCTAPSISNGPD